ncbi:3'-5' exonuclease [bacterium]|nr:3'-5' exonuclease [bacterium]
MKLRLRRPLVVFDLETTGINISNDRIVELYAIKVQPDGEEQHMHKLINPTIPIPPEVSEIHGIYDADVADKPTFKDLAAEINQFMLNCDFGGFNSNRFDFPLLVEEFYRAGIDFEIEQRKFIDAQRIFHKKEPRNLAAAYKFYCDKELIDAHSAKADTEATWNIIKSQVEHYDDLEPDIDSLHAFSGQSEFLDFAMRIKRGPKNEAIFNFGKHKNKKVMDVFMKEPSYYDWMMRGDFAENTKRVITRVMLELRKG